LNATAVDTSALVACAVREPEADAFWAVLRSERCLIGAPTMLELHMVLTGQLGEARAKAFVSTLTAVPNMAVIPFDERLLAVAMDGFSRYGRNSGSAARLNYGDCMAYAVSRGRGAPLLFKGRDFRQTDVMPHPDSA
jgi:ribonuclease VapC